MEQAGSETSFISKVWVWLRDPASINKIKGQSRRMPAVSHVYTYLCMKERKNEITSGVWRCSSVAELLVACVRSWLWQVRKSRIIVFGLCFMVPHPNLNSLTLLIPGFSNKRNNLCSIQWSQCWLVDKELKFILILAYIICIAFECKSMYLNIMDIRKEWWSFSVLTAIYFGRRMSMASFILQMHCLDFRPCRVKTMCVT